MPIFHFQGIFSYINERDTSTHDCKHKHMLENGAPPDKFGILYTFCYIIEFHGFNSNVLGLSHWFLLLTRFFTDSMGPFNNCNMMGDVKKCRYQVCISSGW